MRVDHLYTHFFACGEPEFDVKCKCLHKNVTSQIHGKSQEKRTINADQ